MFSRMIILKENRYNFECRHSHLSRLMVNNYC